MDLKTTYLGLALDNPLVPSASPLCESLDNLKRMEDSGAGAVVLHSLFEEQIEREGRSLAHYLAYGTESYAESLSFLPEVGDYRFGPDQYLEHLSRAREALRIPVVASLNGNSPGGWTGYAQRIEQAGAAALELNIYHVAADPQESAAEVETRYLDVVRSVRASVRLPLAVKVGPYFSAMASMARSLVDSGADGLVLFNRFYQPDIDIDELEVRPHVLLSTSDLLRLRLRWIALLHGRVKASLAATGGILSHEDVLKTLMAGADVTMLCAALLRYGIGHIGRLKAGMLEWMAEHEYTSVDQMKGSMSQQACPNPSEFERAHYMKALTGYHLAGSASRRESMP